MFKCNNVIQSNYIVIRQVNIHFPCAVFCNCITFVDFNVINTYHVSIFLTGQSGATSEGQHIPETPCHTSATEAN